jgi:RND superfamily putative drug exporter
MCPLLAFSVIIGIGLDYNVFLLVRVREYRQTGVYTTPQAVALGLYRSANVITAAGVIMAIAFSGLLFSNIPSLNEVSLYLVVAVLFDTFVVRTLVLTSLMGLTRDATWWPARLTPLREAHSISPNAVDTLATSSLRSNVLDVGDVDQIDVDDEQQ